MGRKIMYLVGVLAVAVMIVLCGVLVRAEKPTGELKYSGAVVVNEQGEPGTFQVSCGGASYVPASGPNAKRQLGEVYCVIIDTRSGRIVDTRIHRLE